MTSVFGSNTSSVNPHRVGLLNSTANQVGSHALVHRRINLPRERGPGVSYDFPSLQYRDNMGAFAKFNPQAPPTADYAALAPLRYEVNLLDPCCGQLSAGAEVDLASKDRHRFIQFHHIASALRVPRNYRERPQTPPRAFAITYDMSDDKAWNSRKPTESAMRGKVLGGWTSSERVEPKSSNTPSNVKSCGTSQDNHLSNLIGQMDHAELARRFIYTSSTHRSHVQVDWDYKLPRRLQAPGTTLEKATDPVRQCVTGRRNHSQPQLWQILGPEWNKHQLRLKTDVRKPTFSSPCRKSGQIPLYSGVIGSENMDNIDNINEDFHPLTMMRTCLPQYTPTAHRTTIPGYTGKRLYKPPGYPGTEVCLSNLSTSEGTSGAREHLTTRTPEFGRKAPLSKMITTVAPWNPFLPPRRASSAI